MSCLHVIEHIGLGRYSDWFDPDGSRKACKELARILAPGGNLYLGLSVGHERICLNGHRSVVSGKTLGKEERLGYEKMDPPRIFNEVRALLISRFRPRLAYEILRNSFYTNTRLFPTPRNELEVLSQRCTPINEHLTTLFFIVVENNLKTILELGVATGESTLAFLEAVRITKGMVHSVDIEPCKLTGERVVKAGLNGQWDFTQCDDRKMDWSKPIDLLFIDTSHEYEHTLFELKRFEPYVLSGGFVILHDVVSDAGVERAISEYVKGRGDLRSYRYFGNNGLEVIRKVEGAPAIAEEEK